MRLCGKKSKPTNNKLSIRRVQSLPSVGGDWKPPEAGSRRLPKNQRELLNAGRKSLVILAVLLRFLLCEKILIYQLLGFGWCLPHGSACQYMSANCMDSAAATDISVKAARIMLFKKINKKPVAGQQWKYSKIWRYINYSLVNKGSFEMLNPCKRSTLHAQE